MLQVPIGTKVKGAPAWLAPAPAAAYARMLADGCPPGCITDAGRTYAEQKAMYALYLAGKLKATAAYPGTSKHETGRALDLAEPARAWVRAHGAAYGWAHDRVANEPWHMEFAPVTTPTPAPTPTEDDMPLTQADLEAIDRIVAGRIDERLRQGEPWGAQMSQLGLEAIDRVIAGRVDDRLPAIAAAVVAALPAAASGGATPAQVADEIARRLTA